MSRNDEIKAVRSEWLKRVHEATVCEACRLYYREGFQAYEIAEILNTTEPKVRKWVMDNE